MGFVYNHKKVKYQAIFLVNSLNFKKANKFITS